MQHHELKKIHKEETQTAQQLHLQSSGWRGLGIWATQQRWSQRGEWGNIYLPKMESICIRCMILNIIIHQQANSNEKENYNIKTTERASTAYTPSTQHRKEVASHIQLTGLQWREWQQWILEMWFLLSSMIKGVLLSWPISKDPRSSVLGKLVMTGTAGMESVSRCIQTNDEKAMEPRLCRQWKPWENPRGKRTSSGPQLRAEWRNEQRREELARLHLGQRRWELGLSQ